MLLQYRYSFDSSYYNLFRTNLNMKSINRTFISRFKKRQRSLNRGLQTESRLERNIPGLDVILIFFLYLIISGISQFSSHYWNENECPFIINSYCVYLEERKERQASLQTLMCHYNFRKAAKNVIFIFISLCHYEYYCVCFFYILLDQYYYYDMMVRFKQKQEFAKQAVFFIAQLISIYLC